ncbi:hypothetical protein Hanom_Chr14g01303641 [Helianthus anomalus]
MRTHAINKKRNSGFTGRRCLINYWLTVSSARLPTPPVPSQASYLWLYNCRLRPTH